MSEEELFEQLDLEEFHEVDEEEVTLRAILVRLLLENKLIDNDPVLMVQRLKLLRDFILSEESDD